jgi:hypothetical protein
MLREVENLHDMLLVSEHWKEDHIKVIKAENATLWNIFKGLRWLNKMDDKDDFSLVYITTHGGQLSKDIWPRDEKDGRDELLVSYLGFQFPWAIIWDDLLNLMLSLLSAKGVCLIVDSCFSGGFNDPPYFTNFIRNKRGFSPKDNNQVSASEWMEELAEDLRGKGRVVLMSCREDELSYGSVFTKILIKGLRGYADANDDRLVSAEEAFVYVEENIDSSKMHPTIYDGYTGELQLTEVELPHWYLQWAKKYDDLYRSGGPRPIGDIDEDGVNEVIVSGFNTSAPGVCRILSYDEEQGTYIEEHSWSGPDPYGRDSIRPDGISVIDLDDDGDLEFCVAWYDYYTDVDGVYAYDWDGVTLTQLDIYNGSGFNWVRVTIPCDYDDDGDIELVIANYPKPPGPGDKHITALGWDNTKDEFIEEAFWSLSGYEDKSCTIQGGDTDNDGKTEIVATLTALSITDTGTWVLNWNENIGEWEEEVIRTDYPENTPKGVDIGDLNGNGIPEIAIGTWGGLDSKAWLYEWNGAEYEEVWYKEYPWEEEQGSIDYAVAIGDADNDGINELCIATNRVHIYQWDGTYYFEEATLTKDSIGTIVWLNIGDCDSDGSNELKTCDWQLEGKEYIYKYNGPPCAPEIDGPPSGNPRVEYNYTFVTTDPEGDDVIYWIDWGDKTYEQWIGPYKSGEEISISHNWTEKGNFIIKAKARDSFGGESDWATFDVKIGRKSREVQQMLFYCLLEQFPLLQKILLLQR